MNRIKIVFLVILIVSGIAGCKSDDDLVKLNPDAGPDFVDIENDGYKVSLAATEAMAGQTGTWRIYIGENGYFDDNNDPRTTFHGEPGETYLLGWELSIGDQYQTSTISVSFKPLRPVILNQPVDTVFNNHSNYLRAENPRFGAMGKWEIIDGEGARIVNPDSSVADFIGQPYTYYRVSWILSYGSKSVSEEYEFNTHELKALAGIDELDIKTSKDEIKYHTLNAFLPAGSSAEWTLIEGDQGAVLDRNDPFTLFQGVADTLYSLKWTVSLDGVESSDTVKIRFRGKWGMWTDERDDQAYRFAEINGLEWMAENYNYAYYPGYESWYYGQAERSVIDEGYPVETEEDRKKYGRLYSWYAAMESAPEGWRLPTYDEYQDLFNFLGGEAFASEKLRVGGSTGLDLDYPGYFDRNSPGDPAFRNVFYAQDKYGFFWTSTFVEHLGKASAILTIEGSEGFGLGSLSVDYYAVSCRYVREVQ